MNYDVDYDVGCTMAEIDDNLRNALRAWMLTLIGSQRQSLSAASFAHLMQMHAFDLAVDCAYDLGLATEPHFEIPVYVVEVAESLLGEDK
jgi:hypothetical protein